MSPVEGPDMNETVYVAVSSQQPVAVSSDRPALQRFLDEYLAKTETTWTATEWAKHSDTYWSRPVPVTRGVGAADRVHSWHDQAIYPLPLLPAADGAQ